MTRRLNEADDHKGEDDGWAVALKILDSPDRLRFLTLGEKVIRRMIEINADKGLPELARLSSVLRELGEPKEALRATDGYHDKRYPLILTSRAAAYCDLKQYEEAKEEISLAFDCCRNRNDKNHARNVIRRIKSEGPR